LRLTFFLLHTVDEKIRVKKARSIALFHINPLPVGSKINKIAQFTSASQLCGSF
jgi:hypothetical protein